MSGLGVPLGWNGWGQGFCSAPYSAQDGPLESTQPAPPPSAPQDLPHVGTHGTSHSWMESTGFSPIWRQKRKLEGGAQASRIESTIITACWGLCCLLFAFLVEKLLAGRGGGGAVLGLSASAGPEKQVRDRMVSPSTQHLQTCAGHQLRTFSPTCAHLCPP